MGFVVAHINNEKEAIIPFYVLQFQLSDKPCRTCSSGKEGLSCNRTVGFRTQIYTRVSF